MRILGWLTIIGGIALALFVGIYLLLYGGILQILNGADAKDNPAIAWGIVRVIFAMFSTVIIIGLSVFFGSFLISEANFRKRNRRMRRLIRKNRRNSSSRNF